MEFFQINYNLQHHFDGGHFDVLHFEKSGIIRIQGWLKDVFKKEEIPKIYIDDTEILHTSSFRSYRSDVAKSLESNFLFHGVIHEYVNKNFFSGKVKIKVVFKNEIIFSQYIFIETKEPAYYELLNKESVDHRENLYLEGPPVEHISDEVLALLYDIKGPVLDFGCGIGNIVKFLRERDIEAYGIELNREAIKKNILPEVAPYITLFDGKKKLPFKKKQFSTTIAIEVIEHIDDYMKVLSEIAFITRDTYIMSVPDASSIPLLSHNMVIPWHMLESTHVNFFTQQSLEKILAKYYTNINMLKIGEVVTNNTQWHTSLAAICEKKEDI